MDYLIAIGAALVAAVVIFLLFSAIGNSDVNVTHTTASRKSHPKKPRKVKRRAQEDDVLDFETETLIARELQMNSSGMSKDSKTVRPESLEEIRERRQAKDDQRRSNPVVQPKDVAERQVLIDRELGFKHVEVPRKVPKNEKPPTPPPSQAEDMDRKLSQFFRNNKRGKKPNFSIDEDEAPKAGTGGRVVLKREINSTTTRSWD